MKKNVNLNVTDCWCSFWFFMFPGIYTADIYFVFGLFNIITYLAYNFIIHSGNCKKCDFRFFSLRLLQST
jgi:hypothetical protein